MSTMQLSSGSFSVRDRHFEEMQEDEPNLAMEAAVAEAIEGEFGAYGKSKLIVESCLNFLGEDFDPSDVKVEVSHPELDGVTLTATLDLRGSGFDDFMEKAEAFHEIYRGYGDMDHFGKFYLKWPMGWEDRDGRFHTDADTWPEQMRCDFEEWLTSWAEGNAEEFLVCLDVFDVEYELTCENNTENCDAWTAIKDQLATDAAVYEAERDARIKEQEAERKREERNRKARERRAAKKKAA